MKIVLKFLVLIFLLVILLVPMSDYVFYNYILPLLFLIVVFVMIIKFVSYNKKFKKKLDDYSLNLKMKRGEK